MSYMYLYVHEGLERSFSHEMTCVFYNVEIFRVAKRNTDEKSFFGGQLHVCYAPEYETVEETRQKLQDRRRYVNRASQNTGIV